MEERVEAYRIISEQLAILTKTDLLKEEEYYITKILHSMHKIVELHRRVEAWKRFLKA